MPTEQEFINYKDFVESLDEATPSENDKAVFNDANGPKSSLYSVIANFVLNLWAAFVNAFTAKTSFASGDKIPFVNGSTGSTMEASKLLELTAQNVLTGNKVLKVVGTQPAYTELSDYKECGNYSITNPSVITDLPSDYGAANYASLLLVLDGNAANNVQLLIKVTGKKAWKRYSPKNTGTPEDWIAIDTFYGDLVNDLGFSTFAECVNEGFYYALSSDLSRITDKPSGLTGNSVCLKVTKARSNRNLQVLETLDGVVYRRWSSESAPYQSGTWTQTPVSKSVDDMNVTALSSISDIGTYAVPLSYLGNITDLPTADTRKSAFLNVNRINATSLMQTITFSDGKSWYRTISGGTPVVEWKPCGIFHGNIVNDLGYTSLEDCRDEGIYFATSNEAPSITDKPSNYGNNALVLEVYKGNNSYNLQIVHSFREKSYKRYSPIDPNDSVSNVSRWFDTSSVHFGNLVSDMNFTSIKQCRLEGFYFATTSDLGNISDLPSDFGATGSFCVRVQRANVNYNLQTLEDLNGRVWKRYSPCEGSSSAESAWKNLSIDSGLAVTRVAALGDSITEGYWADSQGYLHGPTANKNWPYYVGLINRWNVTNYGAGGAGYVHNGTVAPKTKNAAAMVDDINFANFDLVTLAFGINDWHYSCDIGDLSTSTSKDGTMVGNMIYCIEKILTDNPNAKIVVIGPFNSSAFGGDFSTYWGLGSSLPTSGTLQNVIDKLKSVCDYYGLQYIDCINNSVVNRYNIESVLPDGLHPAQEGYIPIAKFLSKQILFE